MNIKKCTTSNGKFGEEWPTGDTDEKHYGYHLGKLISFRLKAIAKEIKTFLDKRILEIVNVL